MADQDIEITDTTTTMNKSCRTYLPEKIEVRESVFQPEVVAVKCGNLEIIQIPFDDDEEPLPGMVRLPRYKILVDGNEVAAKRICLTIALDEAATAELTWMPDLYECKKKWKDQK